MTERENYLRCLEMRNPDWIPVEANFAPRTWHKYRERLEEIVLEYPDIFPDFEQGSVDFDNYPPVYREGEYFTDNWGCVWYNGLGGLEGQVVESPLEDWGTLESYRPPDSATKTERGERDWDEIRRTIEERRAAGKLTYGAGERLFDRLYFLRGFENLMVDIATDDPHLPKLIDMLLEYETELVKRSLEIGVDIVGFHTDIGTQNGLMISPAQFRRYIKPMFSTLFSMCRDAGTHVSLSSDGRVLEIVDDFVECGVSVHDPQYRANTLEGIKKHYQGKMCIKLDLDRQMYAFATPKEIRKHVRTAVETLYQPEGGLILAASVWDDITPLENIRELCSSLRDYCTRT